MKMVGKQVANIEETKTYKKAHTKLNDSVFNTIHTWKKDIFD